MSARDYVEKDYYAALGVPKDASQADIKKAYRKLARQHHPDANKGDAASEERFKEISEAYDVLSDDAKRKEYDEARTLFGGGGFRMPRGGGNGQGVQRHRQPEPQRGWVRLRGAVPRVPWPRPAGRRPMPDLWRCRPGDLDPHVASPHPGRSQGRPAHPPSRQGRPR